jgi:3-deoxy-D-manno-octulosonic-acid transferase
MLSLYSTLLTVGFLLMSPLFILRREKYAAGFKQRLGNYPEFEHDDRTVIWLHCVSVGETNAARPLVEKLLELFPDHRLIISTTTRTGQDLANKAFAGKADAVFYFPFDWKFSVRRAIRHFKPSVVLLMETEIWPRFIREAKHSGAKIAIVNGRLSERSFGRYTKARGFVRNVLATVDLALMQGANDANRLISLGLAATKAKVTGNLKFDIVIDPKEVEAARRIDERFALSDGRPVIVAASTHEPEERWILESYCSLAIENPKNRPRLLIAPRHPERFRAVSELILDFRNDPNCEWRRYVFARRWRQPDTFDGVADIILLDSIGELRGVYSMAEVVFVGGSLIPHGGQSILEPAAFGKAIITGPFTHNFADVVSVFLANKALIQLPEMRAEAVSDELYLQLSGLFDEPQRIAELGRNARGVMDANRGATGRTTEALRNFITEA